MPKPTPQKKPAAATTSLSKKPAIAALYVHNTRTKTHDSRRDPLLVDLKHLGRKPKRKHKPQGEQEISENKLAMRVRRRLQKSQPGQDTEIKDFLKTCPKSSTDTDQTMIQLHDFGRSPKRIKKPRTMADVQQDKLARKLAYMRKNVVQTTHQQIPLAHKETNKETPALSTMNIPITKTHPHVSQPKKRLLTERHTV